MLCLLLYRESYLNMLFILYSSQLDEVIDFRNGSHSGRSDPQTTPQKCATADATMSVVHDTDTDLNRKRKSTTVSIGLCYVWVHS